MCIVDKFRNSIRIETNIHKLCSQPKKMHKHSLRPFSCPSLNCKDYQQQRDYRAHMEYVYGMWRTLKNMKTVSSMQSM